MKTQTLAEKRIIKDLRQGLKIVNKALDAHLGPAREPLRSCVSCMMHSGSRQTLKWALEIAQGKKAELSLTL